MTRRHPYEGKHLAQVIFAIASGELPSFEPPTLGDEAEALVRGELRALCKRCWEHDPNLRPSLGEAMGMDAPGMKSEGGLILSHVTHIQPQRLFRKKIVESGSKISKRTDKKECRVFRPLRSSVQSARKKHGAFTPLNLLNLNTRPASNSFTPVGNEFTDDCEFPYAMLETPSPLYPSNGSEKTCIPAKVTIQRHWSDKENIGWSDQEYIRGCAPVRLERCRAEL